MSTVDGDFTVSFNGEIFNYIELTRELEAKGHRFRTRSDTEVILHAYREWGVDCVQRFNGMFAFALWDATLRRLVLCRDRMGVKPLFYAPLPDGLVFASELKALMLVPELDRSLHLGALAEYMAVGYVVHPRSMMAGVYKLPPGGIMVCSERSEPEMRRYWMPRFEPDENANKADLEEELRALFDDAVALRLRSDVPIGILLSAGVDSSAIAATVARLGPRLTTYCVGVDVGEGASNELEPARRLAAELGVPHRELTLDANEHGQRLFEAAQLLDEPLAEPMIGQLLAICREVRRDCPVVLSGEGSDETWFGYTPYRTMHALGLLRDLLPASVTHNLASLVEHTHLPQKVDKYLRLLDKPLEERYLGLNYFDDEHKRSLFSPAVREELGARDPLKPVRELYSDTYGLHPIARMAAVDVRAWLVDNTLSRSDVISMATGLELRVPFMDYRLVELALRVPTNLKVNPFGQKVLLKDALSDRIPAWVRKRRKQGFPTPIAELFRQDWGRTAGEVLRSPCRATRDLFDWPRIGTMLVEHRERRADWGRVLFQILVLEYWARRFDIDDAPAASWTSQSTLPPHP